MGAIVDLTGQRFGKLIPIKCVGKDRRGNCLWLCKCGCGNKKIIPGNNLRGGRTKSCGCLTLKSGHSKSRIYMTWNDMIQRCNNPNHLNYKDYGGRGITICNRWLEPIKQGFLNFLNDMGECPRGKSLDRIDNNKGYFPKNCRWATPKEQNRNMRTNINIPLNGKLVCLKDYCKIKI